MTELIPMRSKYFDIKNHRLLYFEKKADEKFWDEQWQKTAMKTFSSPPRSRKIIKITSKYLKKDSSILEGGCGIGQIVYALDKAGFNAYGIDYAPNVVKLINQHWSHLKITCDDVRNLQFDDGKFDGYWSFGVIEHFPEGYDTIAKEMNRVLRIGGILFLSFPSFNTYRQKNACNGNYSELEDNNIDMKNFYQFALNPNAVQKSFEKFGFELLEHQGSGSLLCIAEDSPFANKIINLMQNILPSILVTAISQSMDRLFGRTTGHSALLVLKKKNSL